MTDPIGQLLIDLHGWNSADQWYSSVLSVKDGVNVTYDTCANRLHILTRDSRIFFTCEIVNDEKYKKDLLSYASSIDTIAEMVVSEISALSRVNIDGLLLSGYKSAHFISQYENFYMWLNIAMGVKARVYPQLNPYVEYETIIRTLYDMNEEDYRFTTNSYGKTQQLAGTLKNLIYNRDLNHCCGSPI